MTLQVRNAVVVVIDPSASEFLLLPITQIEANDYHSPNDLLKLSDAIKIHNNNALSESLLARNLSNR